MPKHRLVKRVLNRFKSKLAVPPLSSSYQALNDWYQTPLGKKWQAMQTQWVNEEIGCLFGYHLMQVGINTGAHFCKQSRINHCFSVSPSKPEPNTPRPNTHSNSLNIQLLAEAEHLPLPDESVDVTILNHALDFSVNPHLVLKEATRVTVPRGYIILIGFNPHSLWGGYQCFARMFSNKDIYKQNRLGASRVKDWLALLDFSTVKSGSKSHSLPLNNERYLNKISQLSHKLPKMHLPMGNIYFILARKDKVGITPIKPKWQDKAFMGSTALPKPVVSARVKGHYADILPLRRRSRKPFD